ncbi:hypothetical protein HDV00_000475 [Rhizophlyctis rosea]|nr:hypothetical protein HDV00_000475 [Rhizophlyctis rosea]
MESASSKRPHHIRLPDNFTSVRSYADALVAFLRQYAWLWQHHAVDFFVVDYWEKTFPAHWRLLKEPSTSYEDLLNVASHGRVKEGWPADLKEFIRLSRVIALPRDPQGDHFTQDIEKKAKPLDRKTIYGMSPKKQHETRILSAVISTIAESTNTPNVLDMGAGQGYLDAVLAYTYGLTVIGVDDDEVQTCGAKRRSGTIAKMFKNADKSKIGRLRHINRRVGTGGTFEELLREANAEEADANEGQPKSQPNETDKPSPPTPQPSQWMLCGLHTCGDLASSSIRHFLHSTATVLVSVGCCYNHLTEQSPTPNPHHWESHPDSRIFVQRRPPTSLPGYPMSSYVKSLEIPLGFTARMLACQATCRWSEQGEEAKENFARHFYRALLQVVISERNLLPHITDSRDIVVGRLGREAFGRGFVNYATRALGRLGVDCEKDAQPEVLREFEERFAEREKEVAVVWTLRALLAEAIESLILVDRFLCLVEASGERDVGVAGGEVGGAGVEGKVEGSDRDGEREEKIVPLEVMLVPIFEPVDSPRNMAIVARKL